MLDKMNPNVLNALNLFIVNAKKYADQNALWHLVEILLKMLVFL